MQQACNYCFLLSLPGKIVLEPRAWHKTKWRHGSRGCSRRLRSFYLKSDARQDLESMCNCELWMKVLRFCRLSSKLRMICMFTQKYGFLVRTLDFQVSHFRLCGRIALLRTLSDLGYLWAASQFTRKIILVMMWQKASNAYPWPIYPFFHI